jgi:hypothetical protein
MPLLQAPLPTVSHKKSAEFSIIMMYRYQFVAALKDAEL